MAKVTLHLLAAACLFGALGCRSKRTSVEGERIAAVEFRYTGPTWIEEQRLRNYIVLRRGAPYSTADVDNDIVALYESGFVDDVRVLAEKQHDGVRVVYEVVPRRSLGVGTLIVGNHSVSTEALEADLAGLDPFDSAPAEIEAARQALLKRYRKAGFPDCLIKVVAKDGGPPRQDDFIFSIIEGKRR
ncbi:hypothetical protein HAHE_28350 [Haloferula helveola]|uniref:POTRA domain-containing protein n=1 Tax=Haloferula helveola TaxID=490095 RepID=A0ABN6H5J9_9BACT|nr:hypothetical protein HAHE_28350 [Haloferula helveola]